MKEALLLKKQLEEKSNKKIYKKRKPKISEITSTDLFLSSDEESNDNEIDNKDLFVESSQDDSSEDDSSEEDSSMEISNKFDDNESDECNLISNDTCTSEDSN